MTTNRDAILDEALHTATNYHPLPVVLTHGEGSWVTDVEGNRYLDLLSAYSAMNFGHRHPALVAALTDQLGKITLTSRAFHNEQLGRFTAAVSQMTGKEAVLPMNSGAEAVETAIKVARKWGYDKRGVADGQAEIIVADGNFHGRTTTIVSFSSDPLARDGFGPYTPGFRSVPYGDADALRAAVTDNTVAVLLEPIQGEAGVVIPPAGYLRDVRSVCDDTGIVFIADEIQSGLGRAGTTFACDREDVTPDIYVLGKALGGGLLPVSAVAADWDVLGVIKPGEHGSTFGGNPLAAAVGVAVTELLATGDLQTRSKELGAKVVADLQAADLPGVREIRGAGLWWAIEFTEPIGRDVSYALMREGVLAKDTHETTVRFAPPLTISEEDLTTATEATIRAARAVVSAGTQ